MFQLLIHIYFYLSKFYAPQSELQKSKSIRMSPEGDVAVFSVFHEKGLIVG